MRTVSLPAPGRTGPLRSKRLLGLVGEERLVEQVRRGNEAAFEIVFERYGGGILSFCRHMLGSQQEAEDAVQQVFASAYQDLLREDEREVRLKPWLYTIARNRCLSMLRSRREELHVEREPASAGLAEQVEQRAELRELLRDIRKLPDDQREALVLAEVADLSHAEIAGVLECEVPHVKALVFRARNSLIARREARETPCEEIREQLAVLSGGSLRRSEIKHHLSSCSGCRAYREELRTQRSMLAVVLPVTPSLFLKSEVLSGAGLSGGAASGTVAAATAGAGAAAPLGSAVLAKVAVVAVLAGGGVAATQAALDGPEGTDGTSQPASEQERSLPSQANERASELPGVTRSRGLAFGRGKDHGKRGQGRDNGRGPAEVPGSRGQGVENRNSHANGVPRGRGPIDAPPSQTPVQRGPVEPPGAAPEPEVSEPAPTPPSRPDNAGPPEILPKK